MVIGGHQEDEDIGAAVKRLVFPDRRDEDLDRFEMLERLSSLRGTLTTCKAELDVSLQQQFKV